MKAIQKAACLLLFLFPSAGQALTLEEGLKIVADSGRDVKIARYNEEVARGGISLARSPWLPQVDLYARETWLRDQPAVFTPFGALATSQDQFLTYGVRASQLLYDFGRTSSSIDSAQYGLKARESETRRARNRSALEFIIAYYNLLEAEKLLQVAVEEVKQYEAHKHDAEVRFSAGVVTRNEVLQADVTLANSRQRYLTAENLRSLQASRVNSLLLRPLNEALQLEEVKTRPSAGLTLESAWATAEAESPEIQVIDASVKSREESVNATRAQYLPTFYLSGGYEYGENKYQVHEDNWSVIAGVNFNLLSGGAAAARVHIARSELASLRITRDKIVDAVRLDVQAAYLDLRSSAQKIEVMKTSVTQAEENLRLQRLRYQEGVGTATELLDAVTLLTVAQSNSWTALYGFERAEAGLLAAMGKDLTEMYGGEKTTKSEVNQK
jgi:outer membrane protein TolC